MAFNLKKIALKEAIKYLEKQSEALNEKHLYPWLDRMIEADKTLVVRMLARNGIPKDEARTVLRDFIVHIEIQIIDALKKA